MSARKRRLTRQMEDLPGLFDSIEIDMTRGDIAGDVLAAHSRPGTSSAPDNSLELDPATLHRPEELRFISFGSGSSGNCAYIGTARQGLLIDAGVDSKTVESRLRDNGIDISTIAGILLTHDHSDHVRYAYPLLRAHKHLQLFCTPRTINGLLRRHSVSRRIQDYHKPIYKEFPFPVAGFTVTAFETSHDGSDNMGFAIDRGTCHFVVATDTGHITERADHYIRLSTHLMLETNYDLEMLRKGRYPEYLKARIEGPRGHMDNAESARYVASLVSEGGRKGALTHIFLCHLSDDNNRPEIALATVRNALRDAGLNVGDASGSVTARSADIQLTALPRYDASPLFVFRI